MLVLAGILFCLLAARVAGSYFMPYERVSYAPGNWNEQVQVLKERSALAARHENADRREPVTACFPFDPNTIDSTGFMRLGFSPKQTAAFLKYRRKGAVFHKKEDMKRIFFVDEKRYALLEACIQIAVGNTGAETPVREEKKTASPRFVSINDCDSAQLITIKGIGAYTASKVLRYRDWLGGFVSPDQFMEIKGLRQEQVDTLKRYCTIDPSAIQKIAMNTVSKEMLEQHPYIRFKAKVIIKYREQHGSFKVHSDLLKTGVVDEPLLEKLRPYLSFE